MILRFCTREKHPQFLSIDTNAEQWTDTDERDKHKYNIITAQTYAAILAECDFNGYGWTDTLRPGPREKTDVDEIRAECVKELDYIEREQPKMMKLKDKKQASYFSGQYEAFRKIVNLIDDTPDPF